MTCPFIFHTKGGGRMYRNMTENSVFIEFLLEGHGSHG